MSSQTIGKSGEDRAARYLMELGYELLETNYASRFGEIDLVMRDGDSVVFCEVKTRKSAAFAEGWEAVTQAKQKRLRLTAQLWLVQNGEQPARFDVIVIYTGSGHIEHMIDAFS